jgi:hypothetical protein
MSLLLAKDCCVAGEVSYESFMPECVQCDSIEESASASQCHCLSYCYFCALNTRMQLLDVEDSLAYSDPFDFFSGSIRNVSDAFLKPPIQPLSLN